MADTYTMAFQMTGSCESKGADTFAGVPDDDSAETIVYLGPQINFTWKDKLSVLMAVDVPVSITNDGLQAVPDYKVRAALRWNF